MDCLFCKIIAGEIPSTRVYEDEDCILIKDINPQAKIHYLLIPKGHFEDIGDIAHKDPDLLSRCLSKITALADSLGLEGGYRLVTNKGKNGCQSVKHIHIHVLGGEKLSEKMS
ncbi:MAG: histidine triad nucleotide-binding protein [Clostridia bacterium]|nr:histidine triad nucleotide-binding protein [Clostridia bacterium]